MKNTIEKLRLVLELLEDGAMYHRSVTDLQNEYFPRAENPKENAEREKRIQDEYSEIEWWFENFINRLEDFLENMCVDEEE